MGQFSENSSGEIILINVPKVEEDEYLAAWKWGVAARASGARGGLPALGRGLPPPERPASSFYFFVYFVKTIAVFPSTPRKFSLPPLDRARCCDSESPIESSVAQF